MEQQCEFDGEIPKGRIHLNPIYESILGDRVNDFNLGDSTYEGLILVKQSICDHEVITIDRIDQCIKCFKSW